MAQLTLKDLPDPAGIAEQQSYVLKGRTARTIIELLGLLWRGANIGKGTVNPQQNGDSGYSLRGGIIGPDGNVSTIIYALALQPGSDVSSGSTPKYTITYGTVRGIVPTISGTALVPATGSNIITLGSSDQVVYVQHDFTYDSGGVITTVDSEIMSATAAGFAGLTSSVAAGTGVLYWQLFGVTVTIVGSVASVVAAPGVNGSINFDVCLTGPAINGPYDA